MQNKILILVGVIVIIGAIFLGIRLKKPSPLLINTGPIINSDASITAASGTTPTAVGTPLVGTSTSVSTKTETAGYIKKIAWTAWQGYLSAAKDNDFLKLKSYSYQNSDTCNDPAKTKECNDLMTGAYKVGLQFVEKDFVNVWFDQKQIILSTNFITDQSDNARSFVQKRIYFTRDSNGTPKILSYSFPDEVTYIFIDKSQPMATSTVDARLTERVKDSDQDGLPDEVETCTYQGATKDCVKTNPNKRDSLGDGWWDGIRIFLKKS